MLVYRHTDFIVINKPANVSVHQDPYYPSLASALVEHQLDLKDWHLCHRLDAMTSGLLILAANSNTANYFRQLFSDQQITKHYIALCASRGKRKQGKFVGDMQATRSGNYKLLHSKNNPAITQFALTNLSPNRWLAKLSPRTGKTHQLRVAMQANSSPIIGDFRYKGQAADRLYLHANRLLFTYHTEKIEIAALPDLGILWPSLKEFESLV